MPVTRRWSYNDPWQSVWNGIDTAVTATKLKLQKESEKRGAHWKYPNPTVKRDLLSTKNIAQLIGFIYLQPRISTFSPLHPIKIIIQRKQIGFLLSKKIFLKKNTTTSSHFPKFPVDSKLRILVPQTYRHQGDVKPAWYSESTWAQKSSINATMSQVDFQGCVWLTTHEWKKDQLVKMDSFPKQIRNHHWGIVSQPKKPGLSQGWS